MVIGGSRSGKSAVAEGMARELGGERVLYVATATLYEGDEDFRRRVEAHRERRPPGWTTFEVTGSDLLGSLEAAPGTGAVLLDSLTLWVSSAMFSGMDEDGVLRELDRFLSAAAALDSPVVIVSDEVGQGVVPDSAAGRRFRDLLGLANQRAAAAADEVHLCVAGIPMRVK